MTGLTIGQVARNAGVGVETIRFYQRKGLLAQPPRRQSGYRKYPDDAVRRVRFIRRAKELGFSLKEIDELLSLRIDSSTTCADVRQRARAKVADIDDKIRVLTDMRSALTLLASRCRGRGPTSECPILEALEDREVGDDQD